MMRAYPEDLVKTTEVRPRATNYVTPKQTGAVVYYDSTALILGIVALAIVAMVCVVGLVISRR